MLFSSYEFIFLFLPIVLGIYWLLGKCRHPVFRKCFLIVASLFFYSWWDLAYLPLICGSIVFNYLLSRCLQDRISLLSLKKKTILWVGVAGNIGLLVYYKYTDFFIFNINWLSGGNVSYWNLILPLAISFFTLQQIAYLVDSYEGIVCERSLLDYALFVCFFPQLIAGPIVHHGEMMPQFKDSRWVGVNLDNVSRGLFIFSIGLFKKLVLADSLAVWVGGGFGGEQALTLIPAWVTSLAFTFQIYFDFSGYADMAVGLALFFNIVLPINFNSPYKARGIIDYWKRWHMSLTRFITTYIYTAILRACVGVTFAKAMAATIIAMLLSGIWHGAGWTFIVWGLLHGIGLVVNHWSVRNKLKIPLWFAWFVTFNFVNMCNVFFRAETMNDAFALLRGMVGLNGFEIPSQLNALIPDLTLLSIGYGDFFTNALFEIKVFGYLLIGFVVCLVFRNSNQIIKNMRFEVKWVIVNAILFYVAVLNLGRGEIFLYFNF